MGVVTKQRPPKGRDPALGGRSLGADIACIYPSFPLTGVRGSTPAAEVRVAQVMGPAVWPRPVPLPSCPPLRQAGPGTRVPEQSSVGIPSRERDG